jgi:LuxR family transcriptional regulator, maltose regulon positive regulatory protein
MQEQDSKFTEHSPILTTSLRIPQLHEGVINRPILTEKMDQVLDSPLTLISAPAGSGKTTLLIQWISGSRKTSVQERAAWVSLENECDLHQFWIYIISALQEVQAEIGQSALALLENDVPAVHALLRTLINEISKVPEDFVLILDDFHHAVDPGIYATLTFFIDHLPPNLHLVIASRSQPPLSLARWRASNDLIELGEQDLRFAPGEVAAFFNEIKGLNLLPHEITALENRTEGWVAGLQLVALSLQGYDDPSKRSFLAAFTGSQRYILDYLVEEVLQQQPDHIKTFLLRTSILERLSAPLCEAVTGRNDGQAILEYLERDHLFMIPLDHEQHWYRYHHLFKDVLYHRLTQTEPDSVLELHRCAMKWFIHVQQNHGAIRHACAAHEWDRAVELIEPAIKGTWNRGEIRKIITWLGRLPEEYLDSRPQLSLYYLRALLQGGQMASAEIQLQRVEAHLHEHPNADSNMEDRLLLGTIFAIRTMIAAVSAEPASALAQGREALRLLPEENTEIRAYGINSLAVAYYYLGNMVEAERIFAEGREMAQKAGNINSTVAAAVYQAKSLISQGRLKDAHQIIDHALNLGNPTGQSSQSRVTATALAYEILGRLLYEENRLDEAEQYLNESIEMGQQLAYGSALWSAYHTLARIQLIRGEHERAEALIEEAQRYRMSYTVLLPVRLMDAEQARTALFLGRSGDAERWESTYRSAQTGSASFTQEIEGLTQVRLYLSRNQPDLALALLDELHSKAGTSDRKGHLVEILALMALAQQAAGETPLAVKTLRTALEMAEPEDYVRTFVDEGRPMAGLLYQSLAEGVMPDTIGRLLVAFPADETITTSPHDQAELPHACPRAAHLIEPLSDRELEVLQWMAGGASNKDISEALTIAVTTAKKHVSNIIRKLGVDNRTQAVAKGRTLGLCI